MTSKYEGNQLLLLIVLVGNLQLNDSNLIDQAQTVANLSLQRDDQIYFIGFFSWLEHIHATFLASSRENVEKYGSTWSTLFLFWLNALFSDSDKLGKAASGCVSVLPHLLFLKN